MKRGWTYSLCLAVVAVMASPALAAVDVQLNLRYTNPNDPNSGGTWDLLVQSSATNGMSGIAVNVNGNLGVTGTDLPAGVITPAAGVFDNNTTSVFRYRLVGPGVTEIVAGDDLIAGNLVLGVGRPTFASNVANDDLFPNKPAQAGQHDWDNSTRIASGSWTGARPTLGTIAVNEFDTTAPTPKAVAATLGVQKVRGDSIGVDGLKAGDANRDGVVNSSDLSLLLSNFNGTPRTWDQGNFNNTAATPDTVVNSSDLSLLLSNFNGNSPSVPVGSVPEPGSFVMAAGAFAALLARRRR